MSDHRIMVVGSNDAQGVALGIAAECHRQNAMLKIYTDCKEQAAHSAKLYEAITGDKPHKRKLDEHIPEYAK
jgi:enoyl-[acyl-carrier-protein] reductase (NADH)